ncbi:MAG: DedA family protein [Symplocastrum torsivum CPER-KK1]|jgi:membrane protein DedA with SNARE-associated domain|uniref:DedA family protein n=1 Tax=Symplocastrum torsivum CPER-KK1 TaxID=450513 RepID=A0A951UBN3_9CYAN|nr:DedA family protein [Symplocastrum torsivum CPER-KK1]
MLEWITGTINSLGYLGIALLMFVENIFPPVPSEIIMPLAGFTVTQGKLNVVYVILAGMVGSVLGALPWYYAGKQLGEDRLKNLADKYGRWLTLSGKHIDKSKQWFDKHGGIAVSFCRLVPGVRTLISVPAGIDKMHLVPFLLYSTSGTALWVGLLTYAGLLLGQNYKLVEKFLGPASGIVLVALIVAFGIWVARRKKKQ